MTLSMRIEDNAEVRAEQLVANVQRLIALPEAWVRISRAIDEGRDAFQIARGIELDTDLSARLLRIVNSSVYRLAAPVETISRAVTIVGTEDIRDLATLTVARRLFTGIPADLMDIRMFWQDAVETGVFSGLIGAECHMLHPERTFVMGMLHNIGLLLHCQYRPDEMREVLFIAGHDHELLAAAEFDTLGFTHEHTGAALLRRWGLPQSICQVAAHHHRPSEADCFHLEAAIVHVATLMSAAQEHAWEYSDLELRVDPAAAGLVSLTESLFDKVLSLGMPQVEELSRSLFMPGHAGRNR